MVLHAPLPASESQALVHPGNLHGARVSGIDHWFAGHFGPTYQRALDEAFEASGEHRVGTALLLRTDHPVHQWVLYAPCFPPRANAACDALSACLQLIDRHNEMGGAIASLACPGIGTFCGCSMEHAHDVARQMMAAYQQYLTLHSSPASSLASSSAQESAALPAGAREHRDRAFLGLHAGWGDLAERDVYGTLRQLVWRGEHAYLLRHLSQAKRSFLSALPGEQLGKQPSLNPVQWTVGHVAFTFDSLIADTLNLEKPGTLASGEARADAWKFYDSMRISHSERWALHERGALPDARAYLHAVHEQAERVLELCVQPDGLCPPVHSYLVLCALQHPHLARTHISPMLSSSKWHRYAIIHELWHTEDLVHTRNSCGLPPPAVADSPVLEAEVCMKSALGDVFIPG
ncbi:MAG: hypothetical protein SGPRY_012904, partial [Prymnesium sp.]